MFRFASGSKNQLIEAEVDVVISYWSASGNRRIFKGVNLERTKINFFSMSWTIVHPIDEKSLFTAGLKRILKKNRLN